MRTFVEGMSLQAQLCYKTLVMGADAQNTTFGGQHLMPLGRAADKNAADTHLTKDHHTNLV
jgi:hypothetical protein